MVDWQTIVLQLAVLVAATTQLTGFVSKLLEEAPEWRWKSVALRVVCIAIAVGGAFVLRVTVLGDNPAAIAFCGLLAASLATAGAVTWRRATGQVG